MFQPLLAQLNNKKKLTETQRAQTEIAGTLARILFEKEAFLIGIFDYPEGGTFTAKGQLPSPQCGLQYNLTGKFVSSPRWGDQFAFDEYETIYPVEAASVEIYLCENIKWIGPVIARRLTDTFGTETLDTCKACPASVAKAIRGITLARAEEISIMLCENSRLEKTVIELKRLFIGIGMPKKLIPILLDEHQGGAVDWVRENPYRLTEFSGVSFPRADTVGERCDIPRDCKFRIAAAISHLLDEAAGRQGHTCLPIEQLLVDAEELLTLAEQQIHHVLFEMIADNLLHAEIGPIETPAVMVSTMERYEQEVESAGMVKAILATKPDDTEIKFLADDLADDQIAAVTACLKHRFFVLTGAPGTGKTYTINRLLQALPHGFSAALCAPTGKAAIRLSELAGMEATTIHRLIGGRNNYGPGNPIPASIVVVDEMSMVDSALFHWLITACKPDTKIILVGDTNQLTSVGAGAVLRDLLNARVPHVELTEIKRQDAGLIIRNCHAVKNGKNITIDNSKNSDFFFIRADEPDQIKSEILNLLTSDRITKYFGVDRLREAQVLAPMRERGPLSCSVFNDALRFALNGHNNPNDEKARFWVGDKVIQLKNDYELRIINGDIGYVEEVRGGTIAVNFESPKRHVLIPIADNNLALAYAVTVHKYQGSELPVIIMPIHKCFGPVMLTRNLLYTAISRAQRACILVGQIGEAQRAIGRITANNRYTRLQDLLSNLTTKETK